MIKTQTVTRQDVITDFIRQVLKRRFADVPIKQIIDASDRNKINFACPICGDSQKKASKKRGNIYFTTNTYKCFNEGCFAYMPIKDFVSRFAREYSILPDLKVFEYDSPDLKPRANIGSNRLINFLLSPKDNLISITELINRFYLIRADLLSVGSIVRRELERRMLHLTPSYGDYFYGDPSDNKIFIFNIGTRSGKILGFSLRMLDDDAPRRYIIKDYVDITKAFPDLRIDKDILEECNSFNNYFNILNLDFSKKISLTEGQIDACFVHNCIATTGISKSLSILSSLGNKKNLKIIFDRDKGGRTEMLKMINQGYSVFLWNMLIDVIKRTWSKPDDLKMIMKIKDINDLFMFMSSRREVTVDSFNEFIDKFFSTGPLDMIYI